ncbi:hypothetical protein EI77_03055 [Prosthecobacter fusiformis]|uniref:Uncharacterized protein n=1 Tax=Prosthecobacter fusiformis TaxID=48464 RepID=A0A4R7RUI4_9BACT|nr:hypothetical protein [Prosthecobacter fusiformis]TDU69402.1 hypothetical protein EI77_03055 [Prosthecobacter fusiformis]
MEVIDHAPGGWFLLSEENRYYLDIHSGYSFVSWSVLIELNQEERDGYAHGGSEYISQLVFGFNNPPMSWNRNIDSQLGKKTHEAIMKWKETQD